MPITWPCEFSSGPPELPWLIAASVWIAPKMLTPGCSDWIWRSIAETMPLVTVRVSPSGLPIATTGSPTRTSLELASGRTRSAELGTSTLSTATSVLLSSPTTCAG